VFFCDFAARQNATQQKNFGVEMAGDRPRQPANRNC